MFLIYLVTPPTFNVYNCYQLKLYLLILLSFLFSLTLFVPMEFPIKFDKVKSGWSIVYIEGSQVIISKNIFYFFLYKINFVLANSADTDEMLYNAAFHLGLHCLPKYPFRGFWSTKG